MKKLRVGLIGLGLRGYTLSENVLVKLDNITISAVCDLHRDRMDALSEMVVKKGDKKPFETFDYKELMDKNKVDCVVVMAPWKKHIEMCIYALEQGIPCGCEVGGTASIEECFELVEAWERTKTPFMFMENCCYGRREMMALNMAKLGVFGEIVHCSGGYHHDLRGEVAFGKERRHYRLNEYLTRNCENYPTHEIGPIAQILDINRGNRFVSLTSTASKAAGMHEYILNRKSDDKDLVEAKFVQGDIVTTVIKCERGETITITLDTTLPRPYYSRGLTVRGTKGMYEEITDTVYIDRVYKDKNDWRKKRGNADKYAEIYDHDVWKRYIEDGVMEGHGGMDYLVYNEFFECVRNKREMPIDVYDAASWMCITPLSEKSIELGGAPVAIPDFKNRKGSL